MQFQLLKVESQSVQVCWICTTYRYNQTQFRRVEVPFLGNHMVYPRISHSSNELERRTSHSNLTIYKHWNEEKILKNLQMNVSNSYCEKCKHHLHLNQLNLFSSLIYSSRLYSNVYKKQAFKCLFKFPLWQEIDNATFYFLIFLSKI